MRFLLLLLLATLAGAAPAAALRLDPGASALTPASGPAEPLTGTLQVAIGSLPLTGNTTFDVIAFDAVASGGTRIGLDPASPSPGLGVIDASGSFLVPTLFLEIEDAAGAFPLALPGVTGQALFDAAGSVLLELTADPFEIDSGGAGGVLTVTLRALPEPGALAIWLGAGALAAVRLREVR